MAGNAQNRAQFLRRLRATPSKCIETARHQSDQGLAVLLNLSWAWAEVPQAIELGVVDMFLSHLRAEKVPALTRTPRREQRDSAFAHFSLVALSRIELLLDNPEYQAQIRAVLNGWPGIFKWCSYIYDARIDSQDGGTFFDWIAKLFHVLSCVDEFVAVMIETHGSLELVTKLWALDVSASNESIFGPFSTETLGTLIKYAHIVGKPDIHKRVIEAAGGEVDFIVQLALGRVKEATKTIDPDRGALALSWHIVLIAQLCRPHPHPLRRAFFDKDVIAIVTRSFAALSRIITQNPTPGCESMMVSSFNFFRHYLEGDDYLSLVHAIKAGFLPAFVDCSPTFLQLEEEEGDKVLDLMVNVLPRYLVYQSFIEAVTMEMEKLKTPHYQKLLSHPRINAPWRSFVGLLDKRRAPFNHIYSQGTPICCNYTKCQRVDVKRNFKKCGACESVVYCSPECQKLAWKACHRVMCKEMKAERAGNREKGRPKNDNSALQGLCQWVADVNSATFHAIAEKDFPDTPHEKLMPCIDFRHVPEKFSVKEIKQEVFAHPGVVFSPADAALSETRFQVEVSQWLAIPGTTIVQGIFAGGTIVEIVTAVMSKKNFWTNENKCNSDDSSDGR